MTQIVLPSLPRVCGRAGSGIEHIHTKNLVAFSKVQDALDALKDAKPSPTDYCTQGEAFVEQATREHYHRIAALQSVLTDLDIITEYLHKEIAR